MSLFTVLDEIRAAALGVIVAVAPLVVLFLIFQVFLLKLPRKNVQNILAGTLIAAIGLFLFLLGAAIGFLPFGQAAGAALGARGFDEGPLGRGQALQIGLGAGQGGAILGGQPVLGVGRQGRDGGDGGGSKRESAA